jgi:hypothetical protein
LLKAINLLCKLNVKSERERERERERYREMKGAN